MSTTTYRDKVSSKLLATKSLQLQIAIDAAELGFWSWESTGKELVWSERCRELLGVPSGTAPHLETFINAIHPEDRGRVHMALDAALKKRESFSLDYRVLMPGGAVRALRNVGRGHSSTADGRRPALSGFLRDASVRVPTPPEVLPAGGDDQQTHSLLWAHCFSSSPDGMCVCDPATFSMTSVNGSFAALLGFRTAELLGKPMLSVCPESEHARILAAAGRADDAGSAALDTLHATRDGRHIGVELSLVSVRDAAGRVRHRIATVRSARGPANPLARDLVPGGNHKNVTWLRAARVTLDQAFGLAPESRSVAESAASLERIRMQVRALLSRLENRREYERVDLANTLRSDVLGCLTTLKLEIEALGRSRSISEEVRATLAQLLAATEGGLECLRRTVFELSPPGVDEIGFAGALERYAAERGAASGATVSVSIQPAVLEAQGRSLKLLYAVAQEAIDNVARHAGAAQIRVTVALTSEGLRLRVEDDGIGMDADDLTKAGAFGLLAISERLTHAGGVLRISCDARQGTLVEARLPLGLELKD